MELRANGHGIGRHSLRTRLVPLFTLHGFVYCASLIYIETFYRYDIIPAFSSAHIVEAASLTGAFAVLAALLLVRARSTFGYLIGFYFFTIILGFLWIVPFSRLSYNHKIAAASAFASGLAFLIPQLFNFPVERKFSLSDAALARLLLAILYAAFLVILIGALYNFRLVALSQIYDYRDQANFPLLLRYAISIMMSALLPFAFACFVERRQHRLAGTCLLLLIAFYPITIAKLAAFAPFWLLFLTALSGLVEPRAAVILSLLLPLSAGLLSIPIAGHSVFGLTNFRMLAIPSISIDAYNDFFAHHPLTQFCQVTLLKPFMNCAYSEPLGTVMEKAYHFGSFNAPMFATEGIASVGSLATPFVALACGLLVALAGSMSSTLPPRFVLVSAGIVVQALLNVPFTTALLSYGLGPLLFLWYVTPRGGLAPVKDQKEQEASASIIPAGNRPRCG